MFRDRNFRGWVITKTHNPIAASPLSTFRPSTTELGRVTPKKMFDKNCRPNRRSKSASPVPTESASYLQVCRILISTSQERSIKFMVDRQSGKVGSKLNSRSKVRISSHQIYYMEKVNVKAMPGSIPAPNHGLNIKKVKKI